MDINHDRSKEGLSPVVKLTVPVLKTHLRGKSIHGTEWKMGNKKREDLIEDYRYILFCTRLIGKAPSLKFGARLERSSQCK